jgi:hypothetical protein
MSALFDLDRVRDNGLKAQNALVKLTGFIEVERREADMGKSSVTHGYYSPG